MPQKLRVLTSGGKEKTIYWDSKEDPTQEEADSAPDYVESKPNILRRGWDALNAPTSNIPSRVGKTGAEKLYEYGERTPGLKGKAAMLGGAFTQAVGDVGDTLTSPLNLGLTLLSGGTSLARGALTRNLPAVADAEKALFAARMAGNDVEAARLTSELAAARGSVGRATAIEKPLDIVGRTAGATQAGVALEEGIRNKDIKQAVPFALGALGTRSHPRIAVENRPISIPESAGKFHGPENIPLLVQHGPVEITPFEGLTKPKETPHIDMQAQKFQPELPLEFNPTETQQNLPYRNYKERYGDKFNVTGPKQPELFDVPNANQSIVTKAMVPSPLEPTVSGFGRPTWSNFAEQRNLPLEYDVLTKAETSQVPEIAQAVKQVAEAEALKPPKITFSRSEGYKNPVKDSNLRTVAEDFFKSSYARLVQDSPAGKSIAGLIDKYRAEVGRTSGSISAAIKDAVAPLNPTQYAEFQRLLDTGDDLTPNRTRVENPEVKGSPVGYTPKPKNPLTPEVPEGQVTNKQILQNVSDPKDIGFDPNKITLPAQFATEGGNRIQFSPQARVTDPMIQNALDVARTIDKQFTARATNSGIHLKTSEGEMIPFIGKENYWPRIYPPEMFKDKPALIERLIKQGMAPESAYKAVNSMRRFGERLIDPQNARVMDLPEHRKDLGALLKHYDDMAHRVAGAEIFGVKDIADPHTPISQLVNQTRDPAKVTKILTQYLDRESGVAPHEADFVKQVSKFTTAFYLSKFALSNTNQLGFVPVVTNFKSTGKALRDFIVSSKKSWREAEATGALQTVMQEAMRDVGGDSLVSKAYGIKASEGSNRTISAIAGKYYVQDLFNKVKKNPDNVRARKSLEDLTLENWDTLSQQPNLNEQQLAYGATRVVEKTQGRAQSIDLPYNWDKSPYMNLILLYKKYAFVQGKLLKDSIKQNPARNIPLLLGLFNLFGEATGDAKAALSGGVSQAMGGKDSPEQAIMERGKSLPFDNKTVNRVLQNYIDSMFLGLAGDALNAARGGYKAMASTVMGPVIGGITETAGNAVADIKNPPKSFKKSQFVRGVSSHIPFIGTGVNRVMRR